MAYLVSTSMSNLAPVASRVILWAYARHKPALSTVVTAILTWTRTWASPVTVGEHVGAHLQASPASTF